MKKQLLYVFILISFSVKGQVVFIQKALTAQPNTASADSKITDLDKDGDKDIVMVDRNNASNIVWFKNQGGGIFSDAIEIFNYGTDWQQKVEYIEVIDIDNDNDLDIAGTVYYPGTIAEFINDGSQNFARSVIDHIDGGTAEWISSIDLADDNYPEIVSESNFYMNNSGTLDSIGVFIGDYGYTAVSGDFTGDNQEDLVMFTNNYEIALFTNNGNNGFNPSQVIDDSLDFGYYRMSVCDLDKDGVNDILYPSSDYFPNSSNVLKWYKSNGAGNFIINDLVIADTNYVVTYLYAADMDNDGDNDLMASMYHDQSYSGLVKCYRNNGANQFDSSNYYIVTTAIDYPVFFRAADIDGDGDQDLLTATYSGGGGIAWFQNQTVPNTTGLSEPARFRPAIFPNPTQGIINLCSTEALRSVKIYDITGRTVLIGQPLKNNCELNISDQPAGMYFLEISTYSGQQFIEKISLE